MNSAGQLPLFSRSQECGAYLSPGRPGYFSTLTDVQGYKRQQSYRLSDMVQVIEGLNPQYDTWCTQAEFHTRNRRLTGLARIDLQFSDLDTYRILNLSGRSADNLVGVVLQFCRDEGILTPSLLIFSGRGLQAKWLLERPVTRRALPRWNAVQRALVNKLAPLGADPQARDASRVLRLVNTVNTRSGEVCRVVHVQPGSDGLPIRYNFELIAEEMLPVGRKELEQRKQDWSQRSQLRLISGSKMGHLRRFSGRQLAWDRLEDLRKLAELRGGVRAGGRMKHLFWHLNFLLLSGATNSRQMYHEGAALAREIDSRWGYASPELMTLYGKAKQFEAGERVDFEGRKFPPLYTPKNDTLVSLFEITDEEQRQLGTIISPAMAAERHRKRDEARRREAGEVERQIYLGSIRLNPEEGAAKHRAREEARRRAAGEAERRAYLERVRLEEEIAAAKHRAREEARRRAAGEAERKAYLDRAKTKQKQARKLQAEGASAQSIANSLSCSKRAVYNYLKADM